MVKADIKMERRLFTSDQPAVRNPASWVAHTALAAADENEKQIQNPYIFLSHCSNLDQESRCLHMNQKENEN